MIMNTPKGFTLVETLVALSLITIAMIGPFQSVENALAASYVARDQIIATNLAQEGIEYVRSVRDANYLYKLNHTTTTRTWLYGLDGTDASGGAGGGVNCISSDGCVVDPTQNTIAACPAGVCPPLRLSTVTYVYNQSSVTPTNPVTIFTRKVVLTSTAAHEKKITVTVNWITRGKPYSVTVSESIYNWL
ncbi:MAG: putative Type IV pilus pilin [Parcubacteria bacterium C7867-004]|nr:MAG: putative Type IV pilus pilin [Parcubacteria bacterium C7867-004]